MKTINKALQMLKDLFANKYDPYQFSLDMEDYLFKNYDKMLNEDSSITELCNEYIPDLCSEGEPGFDPTHMIEELKKVYGKIQDMKKDKA